MITLDTRQAAPSSEVVSTVADAVDVEQTELPPLFDAIEPDALDSIVESTDGTEIVFEYHGHVVTVTSQSDDRVAVRTSEV